MSSKTSILTKEAGRLERFPDFPPREDMQNTSHLHRHSILTALAIHIGDPETTLVHGEVPVVPTLDPWGAYGIPDLIVVRDCDVALVDEQDGYAIDRQGKAPDFVLEVASRSTGEADYTDKPSDYERFGIGEYWRFDPSGGEYHDAALAGDRLVDGVYEPIAVERLGEDRLRGYSDALGLYVCWEDGLLRFFDPVTESYLRTHEDAEARADEERAGRLRRSRAPNKNELSVWRRKLAWSSWKRSFSDCKATSSVSVPFPLRCAAQWADCASPPRVNSAIASRYRMPLTVSVKLPVTPES